MRKQSEVIAGLEAKGYRETDDSKRHKRYVYFRSDGLKSRVWTQFSHGHIDLDDYLIKCVARQSKLMTKAELLRLVDCPMSRAEYERFLNQGGYFN